MGNGEWEMENGKWKMENGEEARGVWHVLQATFKTPFSIYHLPFSLLLVTLVVTGCSVKNYERSDPKIVTLKTKQLKFNDLAYIRSSGDAVQLELFAVGNAIEQIDIDTLICTSKGCMRKSSFNTDYLNAFYPDTLMQNVLLSRTIFKGEGMRDVCSGFVQKIKSEHYNITYRVSKNETYFKDRKNGILIRIKNVKP